MRHRLRHILKRLLRPACVLGMLGLMCVLTTADDAAAEDWMFRRSYHSHVFPPGHEPPGVLPESRSAYRTPVVRYHPGFSVRGGQRFNNYTLRSGHSTDWTIIRENWIEIRP
jgi:hypothetical protein